MFGYWKDEQGKSQPYVIVNRGHVGAGGRAIGGSGMLDAISKQKEDT